ncbi:DNA/RNA non-specific endonuclease [Chitinophaga pendula]|uniref:DNA/RNA non-specific endonuclease n=1 Tax=Chitinophaga TaxID=79328 RepID=UPI000BAF7A20|nr:MULTISPECIES: DNA/RNA non-specific endonuclease [Chitinophaga]ASZ12033.1 endonuclease [Chitinophaga sp. MD30]UCJ04934.1 DNA/RNA non-specific endonuclease [Chitinophaga pendula]
MKTRALLLLTGFIALFAISCRKEAINDPQRPEAHDHRTVSAETTYPGFPEGFESGTKGAYAAGDVTLGSGTWNMDNALIGNLATDRKNGAKAVRMQNTGKITMKFDLSAGADQVSVSHGSFGSDASSTWELWYSTNGGSSWTKAGSTITTNSTSLSVATFTIGATGAVRFEIRKLGGGRLNIDDFTVGDNGPGGNPGGTATRDDNMGMGNPSNASTSDPDNYLMVKTQYALSYNNSRGTSNWTSWHLSTAWTGSQSRCDCFSGDNTLPSNFYMVTTSDYTGGGFDRGHLCPSADRNANATDNAATFLMTNMMPQAPNNNQQTWARLEEYSRTLTNNGYELYIIAGNYGIGGEGTKGTANTIAGGKVTVPSRVWKIIVVLPIGTNDASRVSTSTRVIAVDMPNTQTVNTQPWGYYRTTVDAIEQATGHNFLTNVPANIQAVIEAQVDNGPTS